MTNKTLDESPVDDAADVQPPGFRTWRGMYLFVLGCFVFYVVLLAAFTHAFS